VSKLKKNTNNAVDAFRGLSRPIEGSLAFPPGLETGCRFEYGFNFTDKFLFKNILGRKAMPFYTALNFLN
jgi:hypothetical protein